MSSNVVIFKINHSYKPEIIVPIVAIEHNIDFICFNGSRNVITADGVNCITSAVLLKNICELEEKVLSLYKISVWKFIKRWHEIYHDYLNSFEFVVIKLEKI